MTRPPELKEIEAEIDEILPNNTLARVALENLQRLNDLEYTEADLAFGFQQFAAGPVIADEQI